MRNALILNAPVLTRIALLLAISYCASFSVQNRDSHLFVFVGKKIEVLPADPPEGDCDLCMDSAFLATYEVLENIHGNLISNQITFLAYDHYGTPDFSKYEHALLYVHENNGVYYHEKYQYSPLYRTNDGRWASPVPIYDYGHPYNRNTHIRPVPIVFKHPVELSIRYLSQKDILEWFPHPYFDIRGDTAIPKFGNYVPELFQLKKSGVLKARGYFQ